MMTKYKRLVLDQKPNAYSKAHYTQTIPKFKYIVIYDGNYGEGILSTGNNEKNAWANAFYYLKKTMEVSNKKKYENSISTLKFILKDAKLNIKDVNSLDPNRIQLIEDSIKLKVAIELLDSIGSSSYICRRLNKCTATTTE